MRFQIVLFAALIAATSAEVKDRIYHDMDLDFHQAVSYCKAIGGALHLPMSKRENKELYEELARRNIQRVWIGAYGAGTRDNRTWYDIKNGVIERNDQFWGPQDNNDMHGPNERCAEMRIVCNNTNDNNWYDRQCHNKNPFVCERFVLFGQNPVGIREADTIKM